LFELDDDAFRRRFRQTPLWRARRRGILRNAAVVLGNQRFAAATLALTRGLHDTESIVRSACVWALGQIATEDALQALSNHRTIEADESVRAEIAAALSR
jgi:epoxyqueuosine reductase